MQAKGGCEGRGGSERDGLSRREGDAGKEREREKGEGERQRHTGVVSKNAMVPPNTTPNSQLCMLRAALRHAYANRKARTSARSEFPRAK